MRKLDRQELLSIELKQPFDQRQLKTSAVIKVAAPKKK
jgi:hypothetical protein